MLPAKLFFGLNYTVFYAFLWIVLETCVIRSEEHSLLNRKVLLGRPALCEIPVIRSVPDSLSLPCLSLQFGRRLNHLYSFWHIQSNCSFRQVIRPESTRSVEDYGDIDKTMALQLSKAEPEKALMTATEAPFIECIHGAIRAFRALSARFLNYYHVRSLFIYLLQFHFSTHTNSLQ